MSDKQTIYVLDESLFNDDFKAFIEQWSNNLRIPISELLTRILLGAVTGVNFTEKVPDWFPTSDEDDQCLKNDAQSRSMEHDQAGPG
jgi:hypothetical protein